MLAVLYLIFNEGWFASGGDRLVRGELLDRAGEIALAARAYERAAACAENSVTRAELTRRAAALA